MGSITTLDYAMMANRVYNIGSGDAGSYRVGGYETDLFEYGRAWGKVATDFKGCVYVDKANKQLVVAIQGTVPSKAGDLIADGAILAGMIPSYCADANKLFTRAAEAYPNHDYSIVGHSLGGGVAQVLGHWTGVPFVTFNAPGMWGHLQGAKLNLLAPGSWWRSWKGTFTGSLLGKQRASTGRNFRNLMDPVSAYGSHYGPVTRFWGTGIHSMDDVQQRIARSRWAGLNPFDPKYKEWGELD